MNGGGGTGGRPSRCAGGALWRGFAASLATVGLCGVGCVGAGVVEELAFPTSVVLGCSCVGGGLLLHLRLGGLALLLVALTAGGAVLCAVAG